MKVFLKIHAAAGSVSRHRIDTSAVNHVNFVCGNIINDGITVLGERFKDTLSHAKYQLKGHETYVRVEAVDRYGRTAWTNPIYLEW